MTTMISNLPRDLIEEILSRVPMKYMRAVRLTCTKWNGLWKTQSFTKIRLDREEAAARELEEYRMIMLMDNNLFLLNIVVNGKPSKKVKSKLTCIKNSEQVKISKVLQSEGLLLCILEDDDTRVVVWNPYLGQTRWILTRDSYRGPGGFYTYRYAIGYEKKKNNSCPNHKVLRFIDDRDFLRYEIYNFDSDLWITLDVIPHGRIPFTPLGISLKGNTYWCAVERNTHGPYSHIICFDFTKERFGPPLPLPVRIDDHDYHTSVTLSCVREDNLAALYGKLDKIEIWITTKIETKKMWWNKFLEVDVRITFGGSFLINEEKKVAMVLTKRIKGGLDAVRIFGESGYFRKLDLAESSDGKTCRPRLCSYVLSSVQIKQHGMG